MTRACEHGWVRYEHESGHVYFFNHETAQSVWDCPISVMALHATKLQRWLRKSRLSQDRTATRERAMTRIQAAARGRRARAHAALRRRENRSQLMHTHTSLLKAVMKLQLEVRSLKAVSTSGSVLQRRHTTTLNSDDVSVASGYLSGNDEASTPGSHRCTSLTKGSGMTDAALLDIARSLESAITDARRDVRVTQRFASTRSQQPSDLSSTKPENLSPITPGSSRGARATNGCTSATRVRFAELETGAV